MLKLTPDGKHWDNPINRCPCGTPMPHPQSEGKFCGCGIRQWTRPEALQSDRDRRRFCSKCGTVLGEGAVCCGSIVEFAVRRCPQCQSPDQKAVACMHCGHVLDVAGTD